MRFLALATDYDGTLATDGAVDPQTVTALRRLAATGRKLILVTGRQLNDLLRVFPDARIFDAVVAENGAVLYRPATGATRVLAPPPPADFVETLQARRVEPLWRGQVVVAIGDAENDQAFLATSGYGVAVANALDSLKATTTHVTRGEAGAGVREIIDWLLAEDK